ncbi:hypothetical protein F3Y22_tig00110833pilonHSYRG00124 [Hibiscus syriacus]|uniref:Uncharacterized protein n=1 Tax=Hibiscus syriacus TaxID=106335 RepID=A0A6A2ZNJ7_HIBSY|nr:hypothetical protein F3Y22_tig00110833pilonHSYRG00124 [Hibiscus syriacus]
MAITQASFNNDADEEYIDMEVSSSSSSKFVLSSELSPDDYFFEWSTEMNGLRGNDSNNSWSNKMKKMKQSLITQKLKASREYLKSLFTKSGCSDESCAKAATENSHGRSSSGVSDSEAFCNKVFIFINIFFFFNIFFIQFKWILRSAVAEKEQQCQRLKVQLKGPLLTVSSLRNLGFAHFQLQRYLFVGTKKDQNFAAFELEIQHEKTQSLLHSSKSVSSIAPSLLQSRLSTRKERKSNQRKKEKSKILQKTGDTGHGKNSETDFIFNVEGEKELCDTENLVLVTWEKHIRRDIDSVSYVRNYGKRDMAENATATVI